jgi:transposase
VDKRDGVPNRRYPPEFKVEAIRLAESVGVNEAAKRLGIPQSSLGNWLRLTRRGETVAPIKPKA